MTPVIVLSIVFAIFGACIGSFLNVCIYRIPQEDLSVGKPKWSFCPICKSRIRWYDNIPILSWFLLRGKCRDCHTPISFRYPFVEMLTAALFVFAVVETGSSDNLAWLPTTTFWAILSAILVVVTFIDIDHRFIPDELSITGSALVPFVAWGLPGVPVSANCAPLLARLEGVDTALFGGLPSSLAYGLGATVGGLLAAYLFWRMSPAIEGGKRHWWETRLAFGVGAALGVGIAGLFLVPQWTQLPASTGLIGGLLGMAAGAGSLYAVGVLGRIAFRKDAMGLGDVKLMALLGAVLGWKAVLLAIFIACMLGSVIGIAVKMATRSSYIPFGPFLAAGALTMILWNDWVGLGLEWYMGLFQRPS